MADDNSGERGRGASGGSGGGRYCTRCGTREDGVTVKIYPERSVCNICRNADRRNTAAYQARHVASTPPPPTPPLPEKPPLEAAHESYQAARASRDLKAEHRALYEENQRLKALVGEVEKIGTPTIIVYERPRDERTDAVACALASDWHIEEPVNPEAVHGLNCYDLDVARARAQNYFQNLLKLANIFAREQRIKVIDIKALGDFFSGWIHEELIANCLLAPGDAASEFASIFSSGIQYLLDNSDFRVEGVMIPGNHGRLTKQLHLGNPVGTSLESMAYRAIAAKFEDNPRVNLHVAKHAVVLKKYFENFVERAMHGYEVKYNGGVGGLTIPLNKKIAKWDTGRRVNLTVLGHFHQKFDGGNFLVNGSLIGYNEFAQVIGAQYEPPQQVFYLIDARGGGQKTVVAPIFV